MNKYLMLSSVWLGIASSIVLTMAVILAYYNGNWETVLRFNAYGEGWFELIVMPLALISQLIVFYKLIVEK